MGVWTELLNCAQPDMKTIVFSLLFSLVSTSPFEILNVEDAEAGYGHQMSGVPGSEVERRRREADMENEKMADSPVPMLAPLTYQVPHLFHPLAQALTHLTYP